MRNSDASQTLQIRFVEVVVASSIDDWFAHRSDQRDAPGDDERVERQPTWDTERPQRLLGSTTTRSVSGRSARTSTAKNPTKPARRVDPELAALKPAVLVLKRRHPGISHRAVVEELRRDGIWVTRAQVAVILAPITKKPARPSKPTPAKQGRQPSKPPPAAVPPKPAAPKAVKTAKAQKKTRGVTARQSPQVQMRAEQARKAAELAARRAASHTEPVHLAPMRLTLDQPKRKPVKAAGWRRARDAGAATPRGRAIDEVAVPCHACGCVPSEFGTCRCT